jgi:nucleotide-binding universal stress UspA family protein
MYHTILVPLDGSPCGELALPLAAALTQATKARLVLVRAAWTKATSGGDRLEAQAVEEAQSYLAAVGGRLGQQGVQADIDVVEAAAPDGILSEIGSCHADLVVMCTHGRSGLGRYVYGSVTEGILAKSPVPVLLVRPLTPLAMLSPKVGQTSLLVVLDGAAFGESALRPAADLASALHATMLLVRVVPLPSLAYSSSIGMQPGMVNVEAEYELEAELEENQEAAAEKYLAEVADRLRKDGATVKTAVRLGGAAESILEEAKRAGSGLIVMPTHGRTGLRNLLWGSVALEVVHRGVLPLLLVGPADLADFRPETTATGGA